MDCESSANTSEFSSVYRDPCPAFLLLPSLQEVEEVHINVSPLVEQAERALSTNLTQSADHVAPAFVTTPDRSTSGRIATILVPS